VGYDGEKDNVLFHRRYRHWTTATEAIAKQDKCDILHMTQTSKTTTIKITTVKGHPQQIHHGGTYIYYCDFN